MTIPDKYLEGFRDGNIESRTSTLSEVRRVVEETLAMVVGNYPISVFGEPTGQIVGNTARYAASGARIACDVIKSELKSRLDELEAKG